MVPETSTTLLREISADAENARWAEFVARYRPMMFAYLNAHFPKIDADDVVQETLIALSKALPHYRYAPEETGRFRNYLTGILRHKALKRCECESRDKALQAEFGSVMASGSSPDADAERATLRKCILEIAMHQLLNDGGISSKSKQIFQRLAVDGQPPEMVATAYGTSRNNVDKVKSRMLARLREIVRALEAAYDG